MLNVPYWTSTYVRLEPGARLCVYGSQHDALTLEALMLHGARVQLGAVPGNATLATLMVRV